jgi:hypothetical protein
MELLAHKNAISFALIKHHKIDRSASHQKKYYTIMLAKSYEKFRGTLMDTLKNCWFLQ